MKYLRSTKRSMPSTFIHQRIYRNQSLVAEENLFTIKLDKSVGKCNCQLRVFVLSGYNNVRKLCLLKRDKTLRCAIYTIRITYIYQAVVHVHQDCYTYIKIRHIKIKGHIYM